jgi:hypothetical protein
MKHSSVFQKKKKKKKKMKNKKNEMAGAWFHLP